MTVLTAQLHDLYRTSFEKAERERRWNVFEDVPWQRCRRDVSDNVVSSVETFFCMHAALPHFLARGLEAAQSGPLPVWHVAAWGYEKSRHQLALSEWLVRTGKRTREELAALEQSMIATPCAVPFESGRQLMFYG